MQLNDFHFDLPNELIARYPVKKRSDSRLMLVADQIKHHYFHEIIQLVEPGDLLIFNDTKVMPARLIGNKMTGGRVEVLVERILNREQILAQVRASKGLKEGERIFLSDLISLKVMGKQDQFYQLSYQNPTQSILEMIESIGQIPLPPYLQRLPQKEDKERYQTVYATHHGSVAAPTAGLHFDQELLQKLRERKVTMGFLTLHIGAGTFMPIRCQEIKNHTMHPEYFEISAELCAQIKKTKAQGKRVIAVGTTSLRALESASQTGEIKPYQGETSIFIYPGYQFHCVDALITNLHLPRSSLLLLVSAFGGHQKILQAYQEAVTKCYRFYSYGDAMWINKV